MIFSIAEIILINIPLIIGGYILFSLMKIPDLSLESAYIFGASLTAVGPDSLYLSLPLVILGGVLVGSVSSNLNQFFKIPFLLAAILTNGLFHGIAQIVMRGSFLTFSSSEQIAVFVLVGILCLVVLGLFRSQLGVSWAIFGNNPEFFSHYKISTRYVVILGVVFADVLAAISGFLFVQSSGFVDLSIGKGVVLMCLTSLVLGRLVFFKSKPFVCIPIAGAGSYFIVQQVLLNFGWDLHYFQTFQALVVLGVLLCFKKRFNFNQLIDHLGV